MRLLVVFYHYYYHGNICFYIFVCFKATLRSFSLCLNMIVSPFMNSFIIPIFGWLTCSKENVEGTFNLRLCSMGRCVS